MAERTRRVEDLRCVPAQRRPGAFCVRSRSAAAAAKVGMLLERRLSASGSPPARASLRLARAWTRASLRGTSGNPPSPSSCRRNTCRPGRQWRETLSVSACNHRRDALTNLLTVLYGRRAAAELVDLVRFTRPAPRPQWLDRTQIADAPAQLTPGSTTVVRLRLLHRTGLRPSRMRCVRPEDFRRDRALAAPGPDAGTGPAPDSAGRDGWQGR